MSDTEHRLRRDFRRPGLGYPDANDPERVASERADLDLIERELHEVESALASLADGTYWTESIEPAVGAVGPDALDLGADDPGADGPSEPATDG